MPTRFLLGGGPVSPPSIGPLTANPFPTAVPPFVGLEVADTVTTFSTIRIERYDPDGTWKPVRAANPAQLGSGNAVSVGDYEAPYGVPVRYRATREDGTQFTSLTDVGFGPSPEVILPVSVPWLVHPGMPVLSQPLRAWRFSSVTRGVRRGVFQPLASGSRPIIVTQGRQSAVSELQVRTDSLEAARGLQDLLEDAQTLLLNVPETKGWGVGAQWVSIGDVKADRWTDYGSDPSRIWTLPYTVVDRPVGDVVALWNYATLAAEQPSYAALASAYASYADVAAHRPL